MADYIVSSRQEAQVDRTRSKTFTYNFIVVTNSNFYCFNIKSTFKQFCFQQVFQWPGGCFTDQREEGLQASPFCVSPVVPMRLLSITLGVLLGAGVEEASVFSMGLR